jgi:hypothetical protein
VMLLAKVATMVRILMLVMALSVIGGAVAFAECNEPRGYRVMAYDGRTHQYTIHRNGTFDGKYLVKKIVVVCQSYQAGNRAPVKGETACDLGVGSFYPVGEASLTREGGPVVVLEQDDYFAITEGRGENEVRRTFNVVSIEVLPDSCR